MKSISAFLIIVLFQSCLTRSSLKGEQAIKASDIISQIEKGENIFYENKTIDGDLDFTSVAEKYTESTVMTKANVQSSLTFIGCTFKGKIIGYGTSGEKFVATHFEKNFSLIDCEVKDELTIRESDFGGTVNCSKTTFAKRCSFEGSMFHSNANFNKAFFRDEARFHNCFFGYKSNFMDVAFTAASGFQGATFIGDAQFSSSKYTGYTDFTLLNFQAGAFFNYAEFGGKTSFAGSNMKGRCDFNSAKFKSASDFKDCRFFASTRFNTLTISESLSFESAFFMDGKPEFSFAAPDMKDKTSWEKVRVGKPENW